MLEANFALEKLVLHFVIVRENNILLSSQFFSLKMYLISFSWLLLFGLHYNTNEERTEVVSSYLKVSHHFPSTKNSSFNITPQKIIFSQPGNFLFWLSCSLLLLDAATLGPDITDALELLLEFCNEKEMPLSDNVF